MEIDIEKIISEEALDPDEAEWLRTQPPEAAYLIGESVAFIGCDHQHEWPKGVSMQDACRGKPHGKLLDLLVSDTFAYACADGEQVHPADLAHVVTVYKRFGYVGLVCWTAVQRHEDPVIEYTEDPVYQATWKALYGDLKVDENGFNKVDPRWSDDRLNLRPWEPLP